MLRRGVDKTEEDPAVATVWFGARAWNRGGYAKQLARDGVRCLHPAHTLRCSSPLQQCKTRNTC